MNKASTSPTGEAARGLSRQSAPKESPIKKSVRTNEAKSRNIETYLKDKQ